LGALIVTWTGTGKAPGGTIRIVRTPSMVAHPTVPPAVVIVVLLMMA
jgi:hypothetical protein